MFWSHATEWVKFISLMLALHKAVVLVGEVGRVHGAALGFQDSDYRLGLFTPHTNIVITLHYQQRRGHDQSVTKGGR
jgi:hypothetical protein